MGSIAEQNQRTKISRYCLFNLQVRQKISCIQTVVDKYKNKKI
jgi:hypothetical protein